MTRFNVGLIILIVGAGLLLLGGISYTTQNKTSMGPMTIEYPEEHRLPFSPIAGVLLTVTGGVLMVTGHATSRRQP
jgi:drug/metabolite transporter (DMT)-like permease